VRGEGIPQKRVKKKHDIWGGREDAPEFYKSTPLETSEKSRRRDRRMLNSCPSSGKKKLSELRNWEKILTKRRGEGEGGEGQKKGQGRNSSRLKKNGLHHCLRKKRFPHL